MEKRRMEQNMDVEKRVGASRVLQGREDYRRPGLDSTREGFLEGWKWVAIVSDRLVGRSSFSGGRRKKGKFRRSLGDRKHTERVGRPPAFEKKEKFHGRKSKVTKNERKREGKC